MGGLMRNVLFILVHDLGPRMGAYGDRQAQTPHLDALAGRSVRFDSHFCQFPLCGPSRATLFSGCRPATTRRFDNEPFLPRFRERLGSSFRTLPEHFRRAGVDSRDHGAHAPVWDRSDGTLDRPAFRPRLPGRR